MSTATLARASSMMAARVGDAGPDALVVRAGRHHGGPLGLQVCLQVGGHVEVELGLGVAAVGRRPRGVTGLVARPVEHRCVNNAGCAVVRAVVARVDPDHLAGQWLGADGEPVARPTGRGGQAHDGGGQRRPAQRPEVASVPVREHAAVACHEPVAAPAGGGGHARHRRTEGEGAGRPLEPCVAVGEDAAVAGDQPVAGAIGVDAMPTTGALSRSDPAEPSNVASP